MTNWNSIIQEEKGKDYYKTLDIFIQNRYKEAKVYPSKEKIFAKIEAEEE